MWEATLSRYPLFDESYREHLNSVIYDQFVNREIGAETPEQFFVFLRRRLNRKMPVFNRMYVASMREIDPLATIDMTTEGETTGRVESSGKTDSKTDSVADNKSRSVASNNPQMRLATNGDYASGMSDTYGEATNAAESTAEEVSASESDGHSTSRVKGYTGSPSALIAEHIDSLVNVDELVLESLEPCFMQMWNTSHSYT